MYPHKLPSLPYDFSALEPHIDAQTMQIHHGKHHQAYVDNLNNALKDHADFHGKSVEELLGGIKNVPEAIRQQVINHAGGHANHSLFWAIMSKNGGGEPSGKIGDAIKSSFGSFAAFQEQFTKAAMGRFGSGWAWLVLGNGKLSVINTLNQDSPVMNGQFPVMGIDVWEHAYYLKYQNRRADYIKAWWNVVNWKEIDRIFSHHK
ncbi:MAG: superoxide dismutase [Candidatus Aenigmarchaeota archaeon]|nr:superoxide dismutase [Candidatus Aenigmarchaeota archaeon]